MAINQNDENLRQFIEKITSFASKTGIAFISGNIYGGFAGFWDYGHVGVEIKNKIKNQWWNDFVRNRDDIYGYDGAIITHPKVWEASGHVAGFADPLVFCIGRCSKKIRLDHLLEDELNIHPENLNVEEMYKLAKEKNLKCPDCRGELGEPIKFNLMLKTQVGPVEDTSSISYLRPENAQSIFSGFKNTLDSLRVKTPFGIAQIGKVFRNEISPRNFLFRVREFELAEFEYFTNPEKVNDCPDFDYLSNTIIHIFSEEDQENNLEQDYREMTLKEAWDQQIFKNKWQAYWLTEFFLWFNKLGIKKKNMRFRQHLQSELSHYALDTWDLEYKYSFGFKELMGCANRTQYDLTQHQNHSRIKMEMQEQSQDGLKRFIPFVVAEPSMGIGRILLALIAEGYKEEEVKGRPRIVFKLSPKLAPYDLAIFPLQKDEKLVLKAKEIFTQLRKDNFVSILDIGGSIGKKYRRQDEIGTPFCVTVDFDSLEDNSVTIRDRDSMEQIRVPITQIADEIRRKQNEYSVD